MYGFNKNTECVPCTDAYKHEPVTSHWPSCILLHNGTETSVGRGIIIPQCMDAWAGQDESSVETVQFKSCEEHGSNGA